MFIKSRSAGRAQRKTLRIRVTVRDGRTDGFFRMPRSAEARRSRLCNAFPSFNPDTYRETTRNERQRDRERGREREFTVGIRNKERRQQGRLNNPATAKKSD